MRLHTPVEVGELPAIPRAAVASLRGPYSAVAGAWNDLITWIYDRGETPAMPIREVYAAGPMDTSDPAAFVTYLQVPLQDQPLRPT